MHTCTSGSCMHMCPLERVLELLDKAALGCDFDKVCSLDSSEEGEENVHENGENSGSLRNHWNDAHESFYKPLFMQVAFLVLSAGLTQGIFGSGR